ncbi:hypothetical protein HPP92_024105 [Vanilla planifolia]|uniref:Uncharacterized protein n=1 Tax=Vanilla planifolia TaxID=51239 RepID=A0A835PLD2_VANPL|nr:hypothetical protein HPP92_024105 [Vanilla planifolia]
MYNTSLCSRSHITFLSASQLKPSSPHLCPSHGNDFGLMFNLLLASSYLSSFLLLLHLSSFLLTKLFFLLQHRASSKRGSQLRFPCHEDSFVSTTTLADEFYVQQDFIADAILGGEESLFPYARSHDEKDTLLDEEGRDNKEQILLGQKDGFVLDSVYGSPQEDLPLDSQSIVAHVSHHLSFEDNKHEPEDAKLATAENAHSDTNKLKLNEVRQEKESYGGSFTGESTSKSSIEWRTSTILRDSETEYPFSSSSRRSSANWESYAMFKKYDEEMMLYYRISQQKLTETESFRSINHKPRTLSKRIVNKLMPKHKTNSMRKTDPFQELENAYVAQVCLAWEALNWSYCSFRRSKSNQDIKISYCPARTAQKFQQFQVLLHRFVENEPYEYGARPEVFARMRLSCPKLLQVPEFRDSEGDDDREEAEAKISAAEFLSVLEDSILTFMSFLKADKMTPCKKLKALIRRKSSSVDHNYLRLLKKINKKKKMRLKELVRWRNSSKKKKKLMDEQEMEAIMAIIDMKVVSRVLRLQDMTEEQLHWCEEKMSKVRVWDAKIQRDSSPLFPPAH